MSVERVTFVVAGDRVVGDLHRPSAPGPHPGVAVAGPMTSVRAQVTGVYAAALAMRGIAALAIDHRGFGESEGTPRHYEHHGRKVADLRAAIDHLASGAGVAAGAVGIVGICLGAGYAVAAATQDPRIRAVGAVAGYYRDPAALRARDPADFDAKVAQGRAARERYEATGVLDLVPAAAPGGDAAMQTPDTVDYYTRRAAVATYANAFAVMSREPFLTFDVQSRAAHLACPIAMVHSENALSPAWARQFYGAVAAPKSIDWLASRGQTDFYDDPVLVAASADRIASHLHAQLKPC